MIVWQHFEPAAEGPDRSVHISNRRQRAPQRVKSADVRRFGGQRTLQYTHGVIKSPEFVKNHATVISGPPAFFTGLQNPLRRRQGFHQTPFFT